MKGSGVGFGVTNPNNGQFLSCNDQPLKLKYAAYGKNTIDLGICGKNAYSPLWILNGTLEIQADDIPFFGIPSSYPSHRRISVPEGIGSDNRSYYSIYNRSDNPNSIYPPK